MENLRFEEARAELIRRLDLAESSGASVGDSVERVVAGVRLHRAESPGKHGAIPEESELLGHVLNLLRNSRALHLDDLLDELRELPMLPTSMAVETVLKGALLDLWDLRLVDWPSSKPDVAREPPGKGSTDEGSDPSDDDSSRQGKDGADSADDEDDDELEDDGEDENQSSEYVPFEELEADDQVYWCWNALLGEGPTSKDDAVRTVAEHLRDEGLASFRRLHSRGSLYAAIKDAVRRGVRSGRLDRPSRGHVRARVSIKELRREWKKREVRALWRDLLVDVLGEEGAIDRDTAIRLTAERAVEIYGIKFERLRSDGRIATWVRSAINSGIRKGLIVRAGPGEIALSENVGGDDSDDELEDDDELENDDELEDEDLDDDELDDAAEPDDAEPSAPSPPQGRLCVDFEPLVLDPARDVLTLQLPPRSAKVPEELTLAFLIDLVLTEWSDVEPKSSAPWVAYVGTDRPHYMGHTTWFGLAKSVSLPMVDRLQGLIERMGFEVLREHARPLQHSLSPFAASTERGLELLVSPSGAGAFDLVELVGYARARDVYIRRYAFGDATAGG